MTQQRIVAFRFVPRHKLTQSSHAAQRGSRRIRVERRAGLKHFWRFWSSATGSIWNDKQRSAKYVLSAAIAKCTFVSLHLGLQPQPATTASAAASSFRRSACQWFRATATLPTVQLRRSSSVQRRTAASTTATQLHHSTAIHGRLAISVTPTAAVVDLRQ